MVFRIRAEISKRAEELRIKNVAKFKVRCWLLLLDVETTCVFQFLFNIQIVFTHITSDDDVPSEIKTLPKNVENSQRCFIIISYLRLIILFIFIFHFRSQYFCLFYCFFNLCYYRLMFIIISKFKIFLMMNLILLENRLWMSFRNTIRRIYELYNPFNFLWSNRRGNETFNDAF